MRSSTLILLSLSAALVLTSPALEFSSSKPILIREIQNQFEGHQMTVLRDDVETYIVDIYQKDSD